MCFAFLAASNTTTINSDNSDNNNDNKTPLLDYPKNQAKVVLKGGGGGGGLVRDFYTLKCKEKGLRKSGLKGLVGHFYTVFSACEQTCCILVSPFDFK